MDVNSSQGNPVPEQPEDQEVRSGVQSIKRRRRRRRIDFQMQRERRRAVWQFTIMLVFIALGWLVLFLILTHVGR